MDSYLVSTCEFRSMCCYNREDLLEIGQLKRERLSPGRKGSKDFLIDTLGPVCITMETGIFFTTTHQHKTYKLTSWLYQRNT